MPYCEMPQTEGNDQICFLYFFPIQAYLSNGEKEEHEEFCFVSVFFLGGWGFLFVCFR